MGLFKRLFICFTLPWTFAFAGALTGSQDVCLTFGAIGTFIGLFVLFRGEWPFKGYPGKLFNRKRKTIGSDDFQEYVNKVSNAQWDSDSETIERSQAKYNICQACLTNVVTDHKSQNICDDCFDEMRGE